jgi:hypothetical protein
VPGRSIGAAQIHDPYRRRVSQQKAKAERMASDLAQFRAAEGRCLIGKGHFAFAGKIRGRLYQFPDLRDDAILL